ncbi:unnamed protein product [Mycena citricolor]|nr:unnamed protein product [Mycena citricolor]CAK5271802.1 unnamed protein product [Mycena citricolor]
MRSPNGTPLVRIRLIVLIVLASSITFYIGQLSSTPLSKHSLPEPECFVPSERTAHTHMHAIQPIHVPVTVTKLQTLTTTIHSPQVTVTAVPETVAPVEEDYVLVNGAPTASFKDNLRADVKYILSFPGSGFTNDVMLYMNLIYLSILTERVPVIPYFVPTHVGQSETGPVIAFGDVFDVARLEKAIRKPILEWGDIKDLGSTKIDTLGCWNVWEAVSPANKGPHWTLAPERMKLDISYTTAPESIKLYPGNPQSTDMRFASLMSLGFPEQRNEHLTTPVRSPLLHASLPPDEQLLCFDNLYWATNLEPHEMEHDYSTAWRFVGRHLHWNPRIEALAARYVRRTLGLARARPIPPYISVHARRGDFVNWCEVPDREDCFAPVSVIARRVAEIRQRLWRTKGIEVQHVIMTSDETDESWWRQVQAQGWDRVDHSWTSEIHGAWFPVFIDAAIQSASTGFVGTDRSTVSLLSAHRVREWQGGPTQMFRWGKPGADDHEDI